MNQATIKKNIKPITITLTVQVSKVNENGTFSGLIIEKVVGPKGTNLKAVAPPQGGGSIYLKTYDLDGITVLEDGATAATAKKVKLF
jgi:hypothetical protein